MSIQLLQIEPKPCPQTWIPPKTPTGFFRPPRNVGNSLQCAASRFGPNFEAVLSPGHQRSLGLNWASTLGKKVHEQQYSNCFWSFHWASKKNYPPEVEQFAPEKLPSQKERIVFQASLLDIYPGGYVQTSGIIGHQLEIPSTFSPLCSILHPSRLCHTLAFCPQKIGPPSPAPGSEYVWVSASLGKMEGHLVLSTWTLLVLDGRYIILYHQINSTHAFLIN